MGLSFIKTERQKQWMHKLEPLVASFRKREHLLDEFGSFPFENIQELKDIGYTALTVPREFGGEEVSLYDYLLFQEFIAQGDGATALSIGWHVGIMKELAENRPWDAELFARICKEVKQGALLNRAASEWNTGSPTRGGKPETTAVPTESGWLITGRKTFTTMSPMLDYFLVSASIQGSEEIGDFLIPRSTEGVRIEETWDSVAMRGTASHDLVLENAAVPRNYLVEVISDKAKKAKGWLLHIPACYLGIASAARGYALQFAASYQPNSISGPISSLPNVRRLIGELDLELMQARTFLYAIAERYDCADDKNSLSAELAAAKHIATNTAISVVDKAMRIVGARSLSEKNPLQRYYLNVRAGLHNPPMDDATISLLAAQALEEVEAGKEY
ncbi:MAG: acyl-CoA dehydrogenase family protein [Ectobacillus sp.]